MALAATIEADTRKRFSFPLKSFFPDNKFTI